LSDGSSWPLPVVGDDDLCWRLTYGTPTYGAPSREDLLRAVSIISAYNYLLLETTRDRRALIVRELREAINTT
jgi:hypothetical protein